MKKNGFTLVELLAVIVILAIIALIAVPVFLGIINKSKTSSDKEGVNLYTDTVQKTIEKKQMSDPNFMPDKCTIKTDGNLECFSGTTSLGTVKVTMKGTKPTSGTIYIDEDDITYENIVLNGKKYYEKKEIPSFSIGDKITYKGVDWYVIENSPSSQDYVTLLKETVLTSEELGTYVRNSYGYNNCVNFSLSNPANYVTSDVKEAVESYMSIKEMTNDLIEVDGYKIRLLKYDELSNLGFSMVEVCRGECENVYQASENTPNWVCHNFGENQNYSGNYWTMTSDSNDSSNAWIVSSGEETLSRHATSSEDVYLVRPVINLLKSAIPAQS